MKKIKADVPRMYSAAEVADATGAAIRTVRRWIEDGKLRAHKMGRLVRISQEDLDRFIAASRQ